MRFEDIGLKTEEHGIIWTHIQNTGYKWQEPNWVHRGHRYNTDQFATTKIATISNLPFSITQCKNIISDIQLKYAQLCEIEKGQKALYDQPHKEWIDRWVSLQKLRFSAVDEEIWSGIRHTLDDSGSAMCVCRTGNGNEYKVIGKKPEEIIDWMAGVNVEGKNINRLAFIEEQIVGKIIEFSTGYFGEETTPLDVLDGSVLSAASALELYTHEPVMSQQGMFLGYRLKIKGKITALQYIQTSLESFMARMAYRINEMPSISNDPKVPCYRYIPIVKVTGSWATWDEWMEETFTKKSAKSVFMAWIGSLIDAENTGKQSLWLHGRGNDGKSKVANCLCDYFGQASASLTGKSMGDKHSASKLENKRLVVISDAKNQKVLQTEWAHNLTGGDYTDIERKGKDSYKSKLFGKLLVCANFAPEIRTDEKNQTARLIYISMRQRSDEELLAKGLAIRTDDGLVAFVGNSEFPNKLKAELPAFLSVCYEVYKGKAPTRADIILSKELILETQTKCADPHSDAIASMCDDLFEQGNEDDHIKHTELLAQIRVIEKEYGLRVDTGFTLSEIFSYLYNKFGAEKSTIVENNRRIRTICNLKLRVEENSSGL